MASTNSSKQSANYVDTDFNDHEYHHYHANPEQLVERMKKMPNMSMKYLIQWYNRQVKT